MLGSTPAGASAGDALSMLESAAAGDELRVLGSAAVGASAGGGMASVGTVVAATTAGTEPPMVGCGLDGTRTDAMRDDSFDPTGCSCARTRPAAPPSGGVP